MRIPFPERISVNHVAFFALLLFIVQSIEGTPLYFSAGCGAFLILSTLAFNSAGGLTRASGAYVFFYSVLVVILGICYKAAIGEAADSNLSDPQTTILVYVGGITAMLGAVLVSRRFSRKTGFYKDVLADANMYRAAVGCIVFGIGGPLVLDAIGHSAAAANSALSQLNQLIPLAIIIGTMYEIRRSGGTRSFNAPVAFAAVYFFFFYGLLGFSKAGLLTPFYCWLLPVCASRFRLSALQFSSCLLWVFIVFYWLVPYSQYGRRYLNDNPSNSRRLDIALRLLSHPDDTRKKYAAVQEEGGIGAHYFNKAQGFWDRLNFIAVDDSLINVTDQGHVYGLLPVTASFVNAIPHVIYPNKPNYNFGNAFAHELRGLPDDDLTTGISFSPTAEAFHMAKWVGIFIVAPLIWILLFVILDSLFGDLRTTPWGLLVLSFLSHWAPETGLEGAIYLFTFGTAIFSFCAFFAAWVAPTLAIAVLGKDRRHLRQRRSFQSHRPPPTPDIVAAQTPLQ